MKKMNKKGWLRIVEAILAILIILGTVLIIMSKQSPQGEVSGQIYERQRQILDIISKDNNIRETIITTTEYENNALVNNAIKRLIPRSWNYSTNICNLQEVCPNPGGYLDKDVYATEILITSTLSNYNPKKLRFFVWIE